MSLLHFRVKERRRTLRVALTVPLTVHGKTDSGERFSAHTTSQSVNRHGALFQLEEIVLVEQTVILVNDHTAQSMECRVVSVHRARDGKRGGEVCPAQCRPLCARWRRNEPEQFTPVPDEHDRA